jgi:AcrR family transcriptional regulator
MSFYRKVHIMNLDKRSRRTRAWLFETLLELINNNEYSKISITDLTEKSGVARQTFYRNYNSMDDILLSKLDEILDDYVKKVEKYLETMDDPDWNFTATLFVDTLQQNRELFKALQKAGLGLQTLEKISNVNILFHMKAQNLQELDEYQRYLVYYLAGGVFNVFRKWFEDEMSTSVDILTVLLKTGANHISQDENEYLKSKNGGLDKLKH